MKTASKVLSYLLHPLLMPAAGLFILFNSGTYLSYLPMEAKKIVFMIVILCTLIIPLTLIPFFLYQKYILNIEMEERRERVIPMISGLLLYVFCYFWLRRIPIPPVYHAFMLGGVVAVLAAVIATWLWKISAHMIGMGGLTALVAYLIYSLKVDLQFYLILVILAAGLVGTARLMLNVHNPSQVFAGFVAGFLTVGCTMFLY